MPMRARKRRGRRMRRRRESRRLHMLDHMPRNAMGMTGTGRAARMRSTPLRNGAISPSVVRPPSGKMPTSSPAASGASIYANVRSMTAGPSFAPARGMARFTRKRCQGDPRDIRMADSMTQHVPVWTQSVRRSVRESATVHRHGSSQRTPTSLPRSVYLRRCAVRRQALAITHQTQYRYTRDARRCILLQSRPFYRAA